MDAASVKTADRPADAGASARYDPVQARAHAKALVEQSKTSFGAGMKILPPERRAAMYAIYAFCREVDDIADEPGEAQAKRAALSEWRQEIDRLYAGHPTTLTGQALLEPVRTYALPKEEFLALIEGMEMDVEKMIRAPSLGELERYCRCVAGAVGLLSIRAFGSNGPTAEAYALALGDAFQLTNILRDIEADARIGRVYLPRELLQKYGIEAEAPEAVTAHPMLPAVCKDLALMAREKYAAAEALSVQAGSRTSLKPAILMMVMYRRILDKLVARGFDNWREPVRLSLLEKLCLAFKYGLFSRS